MNRVGRLLGHSLGGGVRSVGRKDRCQYRASGVDLLRVDLARAIIRAQFSPRNQKATPLTAVTRILSQIESGDASAAEQLLPLVYDELRKLAAAGLAQEKPGQTLQATALVHEAYLRLVGGNNPSNWEGRGHFFAAAAEAMRRILIDNARRKRRLKHGGDLQRQEFTKLAAPAGIEAATLLSIDQALTDLVADDPEAAEVVKLHVFLGLTLGEVAQIRAISRATVYRQWAYARAWLKVNLTSGGELPLD